MSTVAYNGLMDFLCNTFAPEDLMRMGEQLIYRAKQLQEPTLQPYTMEEINAMIDKAEADIEAGRMIPDEDVMREMVEELRRDVAEDAALSRMAENLNEPLYARA